MAPPRRPNQFLEQQVCVDYLHIPASATRTDKVFQTSRRFRLERATFVSADGLAVDAANYFVFSVKFGSTVMASWSTQTDELPANTFVDFPLTADIAVDAGTDIDFQLDLTGTQTTPQGHLRLEGQYL